MGADLYRKGFQELNDRLHPSFDQAVKERDALPLSEEQREEAQAKVSAIWDAMHPPTLYFRDSYNDSNLLAQLDLSWWDRDYGIPDDAPEDDDIYSPIWVAQALLDDITAPGQLDKLKAITDDEARAYFLNKWDRLVHFLNAVIEADDGIAFSV